MQGQIVMVQESRFRLVGAQGAKLFILSHKAPLAPQDLSSLQNEDADVCVHYEEAPDLIVGVAYDITYPMELNG
ncbi:MAG: hypothetical protein ACK4MV_12895 [Beijerinckiaceae bacterium]